MKTISELFPTAAVALTLLGVGFTGTSFAASNPSAAKTAITNTVRYTITDLDTLPGGSFSQAAGNALTGIVAGGSNGTDGLEYAVLWFRSQPVDVGPRGFNSDAFSVNIFGRAAGQMEIDRADPYAENFCAYGTGRQCRPFVWQSGIRKMLPLLGGNNGTAGDNVNLFGQIPGVAETGRLDPDCPEEVSAGGAGPQRLSFKPVIWGPKPGSVRALAMLPGDDVGMAFRANDFGQAVGVT